MSLAYFDLLGFGVVFSRTPQRPDAELTVVQPRRQSAGGVRFGYARTIVHNRLRLKLRLTTAEKDALVTFFATIVKGSALPFFYHDTQGAISLLQFSSGQLPAITERAYDTWETTLDLRMVGA